MRDMLTRIPGARRMVYLVRYLLRGRRPDGGDKPEGAEGIASMGHRQYVGGNWEAMQELQFKFLLSRGLQAQHTFWDIACGSLRAGVPLIKYLNEGNYHGIDRYQALLDLGVEKELGRAVFESKRPDLVASEEFEFEKFSSPAPDFALAQSLFTHLPDSLISLCLRNLRKFSKAETQFFASFFVVDTPGWNPSYSHDHGAYLYSVKQMERFAAVAGWNSDYIGQWNHPNRNQVMIRFTPR